MRADEPWPVCVIPNADENAEVLQKVQSNMRAIRVRRSRPREAVPNVYSLAWETLSDNSERHRSLKIILSGWKDGDEVGLYDDARTNCVRPFVMELWRVQNYVVDQRARAASKICYAK